MTAEELKAQGTDAFKKQEFDKAITLYSEAIRLDNANHLLWSNRSAAYASICKYEEALTDANKSVELKQDFAKGYGRAGFAQYHLNLLSDAKLSYQNSLKYEPDNRSYIDFLQKVEEALKAANGSSTKLTRAQVLILLQDATTVQNIVQRKVNEAAAQVVASGTTHVSFLEGHQLVTKLSLPKDPLGAYGIVEANLEQILQGYEHDREVGEACQKFFQPESRGNPQEAVKIEVSTLVDIHKFMTEKMKSICEEFQKLPEDVKQSIAKKDRERAAELVVSVEVLKTFKIPGDVLEMATTMNGMTLQENLEFLESTQQLGDLMKELDGPPVLSTSIEAAAKSPNGPSTEEKDNQVVHSGVQVSAASHFDSGAVLCGVSACIISIFGVVLFLRARRSTLK